MEIKEGVISWWSEITLTSAGYKPVFKAATTIGGHIEVFNSVILAEDQIVDFIVRAESAFKEIKQGHKNFKIEKGRGNSRLDSDQRTAMKIYNQLESDLEESGATSFTFADIRAASNKAFTGNKDGIIK